MTNNERMHTYTHIYKPNHYICNVYSALNIQEKSVRKSIFQEFAPGFKGYPNLMPHPGQQLVILWQQGFKTSYNLLKTDSFK
jgi:hypothetical protein